MYKMTQLIPYNDEVRLAIAWSIYDHANWFKKNFIYSFVGNAHGIMFRLLEKDFDYMEQLVKDVAVTEYVESEENKNV